MARGLLLIFVSTLSYSLMPILGKLAYGSGVGPHALLAYRFALALLVLTLTRPRGVAPLSLRTRLVLWGLGGVFIVNSFAYFKALEIAPAATVSLIVYTYPMIVALLSAALGLDAFTLRGLAAAALAVGGSALTAGGVEAGVRAGAWLALLSAFGYATYIVLCSRYASDIPTEAAARHVAQACTAFYVPWAAMEGKLALPATPVAWGAVAGLGVVCTVVALRAFLGALARLGPARAAVASSLEVPLTLVLALAVLGEAVGARQWGGGVLIVGAVLLQNLPLRPKAPPRWRSSGP